MGTLTEHLINEKLPEGHKLSGEIDKKKLKKAMVALAHSNPDAYGKVVGDIKSIGDMAATYEGISVGVEDLKPLYKERNKLVSDGAKELASIKDKKSAAYSDKLLDIQSRGIALTKKHPGTLGLMVSSGGRGNAAQLLKSVVSPLTVKDNEGKPYPYLIKNSYSEGLKPAEYWIASNEARQEVIRGQLSTAIPGDLSKQMSNTLNHVQITSEDCGTSEGIPMSINDKQLVNRYLARAVGGYSRNTLITPSVIRNLRKTHENSLIVRSPMTCQDNTGVCRKCYGIDERGKLPGVGTHIGLRSAQALSEPLTQMVLSSKHGVTLAKGDSVGGLEGVRQLIEIPRVFKDEASLAKKDGEVSSINKAPQGGNIITIAGESHYVPPKQHVTITQGSKVTQGDVLSTGLVNPKKLVESKGIGTGRNYLLNKMYEFYKKDGVDIDKRHLEILAKENYNWVKINDPDSEGKYIPGDIVNYNVLKNHLKSDSHEAKVDSGILGEQLGDDSLYYTAGTTITPDVKLTLDTHKVKKVTVTNKTPKYEFIAKPIEQVPLLGKDWISQLSHRRLKDTLLKGAYFGHSSNLKGTSPYPKLIYTTDINNIDDLNF